jgi:hypothetical protein
MLIRRLRRRLAQTHPAARKADQVEG